MREVDDRVLSMLGGQLLDPDVLTDAIAEAIKRIKGSDPVHQRDPLLKRLAAVQNEIGNFTQAIATGKEIPALVAALRERDEERARIEGPT
jgi:hypothetical protein